MRRFSECHSELTLRGVILACGSMRARLKTTEVSEEETDRIRKSKK